MNYRCRNCFTLFIVLTLITLTTHTALGQTRKVTVQASGSVDAKPDQLVFSVSLTKYNKSAQKAQETFDELKKEFLSAFNVMKFKGLSMRSTNKVVATSAQPAFGGPVMDGMAPPIAFGGGGGFGGGAAPAAAEPQFYATETFQMTVDGVDKLSAEAIEARVKDFNKELKRLGLSATGGFSTTLNDRTASMKKAFAKAMVEARDKADVLAALSESKVGKVVEIMETSSYAQPVFNAYGMAANPAISYGPGSIGTGISSTQRIVASLRVTFEMSE